MNYLEQHRNEIFKKYSKEELLKDIEHYKSGSGRLSKVLNQFFEECIFNCKAPRGNKTPMEALQDENDMKFILEYTKSKPKFYTGNEVSNVKSFFRNGGRIAQKVANFCPKNARNIYFRYNNINGERLNVLDTSSGFGSRMSAVLLSGHNYFGFDPNTELHDKLFEYGKFLYDNGQIENGQICRLYCQGSESFREELEGTIDVSFTSPPYFNLEKYGDDNSLSTKNYNNYDAWLEYFAKPTIDNTYKYLKIGGVAMINIKNLTRGKKEPLFDDWFRLFNEHGGFELIEVFEMEHQAKKNYFMNTTYDKETYQGFKEPIMAFRKVR